jgi:hypothetical protein
MSSDASEAKRLRPDRRKRSNDHSISNHKYTCRDEKALHVLIHMSLYRIAWALLYPPRVATNISPARTLRESFLRFEMYFLNSSTRAGLHNKATSLSIRHLQSTHGLLLDQALRDIAEQIRKLAANEPSIYNYEAGMMDVMDNAVVDMPWTVPLRARRNSGSAVPYMTLEEYVSGLCSFASSLAASDPASLHVPPTPRSCPQPVMHAGDNFDAYSHAGHETNDTWEQDADPLHDWGAFGHAQDFGDDPYQIAYGESRYSPCYSRRGRGSRSRSGGRRFGFAGRRGGSSYRPPYVPPRPFVPGPPGSFYDCGRPGIKPVPVVS